MLFLTSTVSAIVCSLLCMVCIRDWKKAIENEQEEKKTCWKKRGMIMCLLIIVVSILFSILFHWYGYGPLKCIKYCCLIWGLVPIAFRDWATQIIPNQWLLYLIGIRIALLIVECVIYPKAIWDNLMFIILGAFVSGGIMFLAYVISRHEIGMGDVKLFIVTGMYLGLGLNYIVLLMSLIISAVYGGVKLLKKDLKTKDSIPFAPFVLAGTTLVLGLGF